MRIVRAMVLLASFLLAGCELNYACVSVMPFIVEVTALLLLGPDAMTLTAATAAAMLALSHSEGAQPARRSVINIVSVGVAALAAGSLHRTLGGTLGTFVWPQQGLPIAAAVAGYCVAKSVVAEVVAPLRRTKGPATMGLQPICNTCTR